MDVIHSLLVAAAALLPPVYANGRDDADRLAGRVGVVEPGK